MDESAARPRQWTVGQLRAELVGIPDDTPLVVDVPTGDLTAATRRHRLVGAGYGPGIDPTDLIFVGQEYPLVAGGPRRLAPRIDPFWPGPDDLPATDQGIDPDPGAP